MTSALRTLLPDLERAWLGVRRPAPASLIDSASPPCPDPADLYCTLCGESIGSGESPDRGCAWCARRRFPWVRLFRLGRYESPLRDWITSVKFQRDDALARELGRRLASVILSSSALPLPFDFIVPVPSSPWRRLMRGTDHTAAIAFGLSQRLNLPILRPLRRLHHPVQRAVPPSSRRANVRGVFRPARLRLPIPARSRFLLLDDIATSRSTLIESARALRALTAAPRASLVVAVLAVADDRSRRSRAQTNSSPSLDP